MSETEDRAVETAKPAYRVLARKYRPADFSTLIGQEALVRTLSNAIASNRLAQAWMLTGVRGVGKTTTARIIARALTCTGPDGRGGPTISPCGVCDSCRAIAEDRHVDIFEMDAASRTGVGDIRELIDSVRYRPTSARYKIYIIDEVHMLSTGAFNALLKTLEEPPEHVKFIFATTEIRKVPVTVLSRCQRFDLRRVEASVLAAHFGKIALAEDVTVELGAINLIARASDGSVRDGLSLLDQAIAHGSGMVTEQAVREMLGLADRAVIFDLFDGLMKGDVRVALDVLAGQHAAGADPVVVLNDLLELTHWLTRLKVTPNAADDPLAAETERVRGRVMAAGLSMAVLTRTWQMLLKAVAETRGANHPLTVVEMALIRLAYASSLPTPAEALQQLAASPPARPSAPPSPSDLPSPPGLPSQGGDGTAGAGGGMPPYTPPPLSAPAYTSGPTALARQPEFAPDLTFLPTPPSFEALVATFKARKEALIAIHLERDIHLVSYHPPRLEIRLGAEVPNDVPGKIGRLLSEWTGQRWAVIVSNTAGADTLHEQSLSGAKSSDLVQAILKAFPGASIGLIHDLLPPDDAAPLGLAGTGEETTSDDLSSDDLYGDFDL